MYLDTCLCVWMYFCLIVCVSIQACLHKCIHTKPHTQTHTHNIRTLQTDYAVGHVQMHVHSQSHACERASAPHPHVVEVNIIMAYMYIHIYTYICICIYIYINNCNNNEMRTHELTRTRRDSQTWAVECMCMCFLIRLTLHDKGYAYVWENYLCRSQDRCGYRSDVGRHAKFCRKSRNHHSSTPHARMARGNKEAERPSNSSVQPAIMSATPLLVDRKWLSLLTYLAHGFAAAECESRPRSALRAWSRAPRHCRRLLHLPQGIPYLPLSGCIPHRL